MYIYPWGGGCPAQMLGIHLVEILGMGVLHQAKNQVYNMYILYIEDDHPNITPNYTQRAPAKLISINLRKLSIFHRSFSIRSETLTRRQSNMHIIHAYSILYLGLHFGLKNTENFDYLSRNSVFLRTEVKSSINTTSKNTSQLISWNLKPHNHPGPTCRS